MEEHNLGKKPKFMHTDKTMETYQYTRFRELLYDALSAEDVERWLKSVGFKDWHSTHRRLLRITDTYDVRPAMAQLLPYLMLMLEQAANWNVFLIDPRIHKLLYRRWQIIPEPLTFWCGYSLAASI